MVGGVEFDMSVYLSTSLMDVKSISISFFRRRVVDLTKTIPVDLIFNDHFAVCTLQFFCVYHGALSAVAVRVQHCVVVLIWVNKT